MTTTPGSGPEPAAPSGPSGPVRVVAVISGRGQTLVIRPRTTTGGPRWRFPSGETEPGESLEQSAVRAAREETGLTVTAGERLGKRIRTGRHLTYIACTPAGGTAYRASPREIAEVAWISREPAVLDSYLPGLHEPVRDHLVSGP
ncbi:hypothetical protein GCM10010232_48920 [Streptomyces amakusaensis]|uniref:NUDIX hydrolase n=1 Tax=Streptomyces amakusaensis TaxID=67271 RepID=A0ABW0AQ81_9ACTN